MNAGIPLGLSSGLCWGAADFFGGIQSRRLPALTVAFWSQLAGALALAIALAIEGVRPATTGIAWGLAAGVGSGCALVLFYRSLAEGTMSIVAPISACGALVPVTAAVITGNQPGTLAALGVLATVAGVVLVSRPHNPGRSGPPAKKGEGASSPSPAKSSARGGRRVVAMALGSALGFGLFYVFVDAGAASTAGTAAAVGTAGSHGSPLWVIAGARMSSLAILSMIALFSRRSPLRWPGRRIGAVALVGIGDTGANLLFAYAATTGNLAVVGVLGSLYPVATVVLARWLLGERLSGGQNAGVILALAGIGLLAAA
ncbi:MAG TPA: DMT family transporter [Actinomycetes bacterium]|nr:DMT family transporter [Actinomycetes bacterium]